MSRPVADFWNPTGDFHGCQAARMYSLTRPLRTGFRWTNRSDMIGDHHGQTAGRATPQVTPTDDILGTHRVIVLLMVMTAERVEHECAAEVLRTG
jgi:hypothetical protein